MDMDGVTLRVYDCAGQVLSKAVRALCACNRAGGDLVRLHNNREQLELQRAVFLPLMRTNFKDANSCSAYRMRIILHAGNE